TTGSPSSWYIMYSDVCFFMHFIRPMFEVIVQQFYLIIGCTFLSSKYLGCPVWPIYWFRYIVCIDKTNLLNSFIDVVIVYFYDFIYFFSTLTVFLSIIF